jgi:hypothetical protein
MTFDLSSNVRPTEIVDPIVLEVATVSADTLRAHVRVTGVLADHNVALLSSALGTHLRAGRRYLRVDVGAAGISGHKALATLAGIHTTITELGGMLVFEHGSDDVCTALREHGLFLSTRD